MYVIKNISSVIENNLWSQSEGRRERRGSWNNRMLYTHTHTQVCSCWLCGWHKIVPFQIVRKSWMWIDSVRTSSMMSHTQEYRSLTSHACFPIASSFIVSYVVVGVLSTQSLLLTRIQGPVFDFSTDRARIYRIQSNR